METYKTSELARRAGIHPNTVRLYEALGLIPKAKRLENGYRVFTERHLEQIRLARTALRIEVLQNGLRKQAIAVIKTAAAGDLDGAYRLTARYLAQLEEERTKAEEAIQIAQLLLIGGHNVGTGRQLKRQETAELLDITIDMLRNWEMNGLLTVKRRQNGYRVYDDGDIHRLKIIRTLRCANYSYAAILRLLRAAEQNREADLRAVLDTPGDDDDIVSVCDKLLTSLASAERNAKQMMAHLKKMKKLR